MSKIRVLIVDDAVVVRMIISNVLSSDLGIEVVGVAASGLIAIDKITQVNPDVITMDVEMPDMNGLETLQKIKQLHPNLPIIMFTSNVESSASLALQALSLGASEFVVKPSNMKDRDSAIAYIQENLIPKIKAICAKSVQAQSPSTGESSNLIIPKVDSRITNVPIDVLAIGISTGGPNALAHFLPELPADFPVPILIVQHMPPIFTKLLADRLSANSKIRFKEGVTGDVVEPGQGWIAPGDFHMVVHREASQIKIRTHQGTPENSCRPAVDVLFRSVAEIYGPRSLVVVMTGMGKDGLRGAENIRDAGGQIFVQDEASSVVWAMPGAVYGAGLADQVISLKDMATVIDKKIRKSRMKNFQVETGLNS